MPRARDEVLDPARETPGTYASWTTASRARSARRRGSSRDGKYEPSRTRGIGEVDRAHPGVPAPLAVPVAVGQAALRVALALGQPGELGHLGLHDRLGEDADALAQEVDVALGARLAHRSRARPSCPRPSWCSPCRRFSLQRREDDAVAASVHGPRCYTKSGDTTEAGSPSPGCRGCGWRPGDPRRRRSAGSGWRAAAGRRSGGQAAERAREAAGAGARRPSARPWQIRVPPSMTRETHRAYFITRRFHTLGGAVVQPLNCATGCGKPSTGRTPAVRDLHNRIDNKAKVA